MLYLVALQLAKAKRPQGRARIEYVQQARTGRCLVTFSNWRLWIHSQGREAPPPWWQSASLSGGSADSPSVSPATPGSCVARRLRRRNASSDCESVSRPPLQENCFRTGRRCQVTKGPLSCFVREERASLGQCWWGTVAAASLGSLPKLPPPADGRSYAVGSGSVAASL